MLRNFQLEIKNGVYSAWHEGAQNVMAVSATGTGKTVIMGSVIQDFDAPTVAIAHRQELVGQISLKLNAEGVAHGIIAPSSVIRAIIKAHMDWHGRSFYNPSAPVRVASVDTLTGFDRTDRWLQQVRLWVVDEGHHVLRENKWGKAVTLLTNARGLLFTAHAERADGAGLGRGPKGDGLVDRLVLGLNMRAAIDQGYLTDYRVICPPSDVETSDLKPGASGELNQKAVAERVHASKTIVGDIVKHYKRVAEGELGITFAVDIPACHEYVAAYEKAGIPAAVISHKTGIAERSDIMRRYRSRQILQLVNVDTLGEGTDVPACTVVTMAQPSSSFQRVAQQFGRMARICVSEELNRTWHTFTDEQRRAHIAASSKPRGILIDHVGNIARDGGEGRHGLPDRPRVYSLERRERRSQPPADAIPLRVCTNPDCEPVPYQPYEAFLTACPRCGVAKPPPKQRSTPEQVEGDLVELDPEVLRQMRGEIDRIDGAPAIPKNATHTVANAISRNHWDRQKAQHELRKAIQVWAGWQTHLGRGVREAQRRFFHGFGVDVMTAQALGAREATELEERIGAQLAANNVRAET